MEAPALLRAGRVSPRIARVSTEVHEGLGWGVSTAVYAGAAVPGAGPKSGAKRGIVAPLDQAERAGFRGTSPAGPP